VGIHAFELPNQGVDARISPRKAIIALLKTPPLHRMILVLW
jgi:hypothetical protein